MGGPNRLSIGTPPAPAQPSPTPARPFRHQAAKPFGLLAATAAGVGYFAATDPHEPGLFPPCLLLTLTGLDCPLCGGSRAIHDLAHGRVAEAMDHNALVVLLAPAVVISLVVAIVVAFRRGRVTSGGERSSLSARTTTWVAIAAAAVLLVFGVVRNLPFWQYLDSGLG